VQYDLQSKFTCNPATIDNMEYLQVFVHNLCSIGRKANLTVTRTNSA